MCEANWNLHCKQVDVILDWISESWSFSIFQGNQIVFSKHIYWWLHISSGTNNKQVQMVFFGRRSRTFSLLCYVPGLTRIIRVLWKIWCKISFILTDVTPNCCCTNWSQFMKIGNFLSIQTYRYIQKNVSRIFVYLWI